MEAGIERNVSSFIAVTGGFHLMKLILSTAYQGDNTFSSVSPSAIAVCLSVITSAFCDPTPLTAFTVSF